MHHMKLKAAVAKFQPLIDKGATPDEILEDLKKEEHGYSSEEQEEILKVLHEANINKGTGSVPPAPKGDEKTEPKFDYNNLVGEEFKRYMEFIGSLSGEEKRVFELMRVEVKKEVRYEGVEGSPVDIVGIRIKDSKPINTTKIAIKHATIQNGFIRMSQSGKFFELLGSQVGENGRFFLLKQD